MRSFVVLGLLLVCSRMDAADEPKKKDTPFTPVQAREQVGKEVLVQMEVRVAKDRLAKRGEIYLDSETDFRDKRNFAVVISKRGAESLADQKIRDPAEHFRGKVIQAKGMVKEVDGVPRIEIDEAKQIRLIEKP